MQHLTVFATFQVFCNIRAKLQHLNFFATLGRICNIYDFLQQSNDCIKWALNLGLGERAPDVLYYIFSDLLFVSIEKPQRMCLNILCDNIFKLKVLGG